MPVITPHCSVSVQEEQLRVALMDYLRNHHPKDHEKMQMVALKFGMFHDLAKTRDQQARRDLKKIKPKQLGTCTCTCMYACLEEHCTYIHSVHVP